MFSLNRYWFGFLLASLFCLSPAGAVENNLKFSGSLVSDPCELDPQTTTLTVDFGTVIEKDLYLYTRTKDVPFTINLTSCDTSLAEQVTFTFKGTESAALPGLLAVERAGTGIAIGLESQSGTPLAFNKPSPQLTLSNGTNSFTLMAYVTGEPEAINQQSIVPGDFSATATFEMAYP